jgi:hypothetical protein
MKDNLLEQEPEEAAPHGETRRALWFFVAWAIWLSAEYWMLGQQSYVRIHDTADSVVPLAMWLGQGFWRTLGVVLNPAACGTDHLASYSWVSLFQLPFLALPAWLAHGMVTFGQRFVAGFFSWLFFRRRFHCGPWTALAAGLLYSQMHSDLGELCYMHQLIGPGLPLMLWFFTGPEARGWRGQVVRPAALGLLAGSATSLSIGLVYTLPALLLFLALERGSWKRPLENRGWLTAFAVFSGAALLLHLPQLAAILTNAPLSHRVGWVAEGHRPWSHTWGPFTQFLGAWWPFLALTAVGLARRPRFRRVDWAGLVSLLVAVAMPVLGFLLTRLLPGSNFLASFNFWRYSWVIGPFFLLAGAGWFLRAKPRWRLVPFRDGGPALPVRVAPSLADVLFIAIALVVSLHAKQTHWGKMMVGGATWRNLFGDPDIAAAAKSAGTQPVRFATVAAYHALPPMALLARGLETADGYSPIYTRRYYDFWTGVLRPLLDIDPHIQGYHSWGNKAYLHHAQEPAEEGRTVVPLARWYNLDLLSLANVGYLVSDKPVDDPRLVWLNAGAREARVAAWQALPPLRKITGYLSGRNPGRPRYVYRNPEVLPRFFLCSQVRVLESRATLNAELGTMGVRDLARTALLEREYHLELQDGPLGLTTGTVRVLARDTDFARLEVTADGPAILLASYQFYPHWTWLVNGQTQPAFPVDGAFVGLHLPAAGTYAIELAYRPPYRIFPPPQGRLRMTNADRPAGH